MFIFSNSEFFFSKIYPFLQKNCKFCGCRVDVKNQEHVRLKAVSRVKKFQVRFLFKIGVPSIFDNSLYRKFIQ